MKFSKLTIQFIVFFLLLGLLFRSYGQEISISTEIVLNTNAYYQVIGNINSDLLLLKGTGGMYQVVSFDKQLQKKWERDLPTNKRYVQVIGVSQQPSSFVVLYHYRSKGDVVVRAERFDERLKLLDSTTVMTLKNRSLTPQFRLIFSQDKTKGMVYLAEREQRLQATAFELGDTLLSLWEQIFIPSDYDYNEDFIDILFTNDAEMHLIMAKDNRRLTRENSRFQVFSYFPFGDKKLEYFIPLNELLWHDVLFQYDNENRRIVAGGLHLEQKYSQIKGYFYLSFNPFQQEDIVLKTTLFDNTFIVQLLGKEFKENTSVSDISMQDIVLRKDGGILLIAERFRSYTRGATTSTLPANDRFNPIHVDYYYDDIMVISIHPNGETHWQQVLYKKQYSQDDEGSYSSFFLVRTRSALRFLYNDEIKSETIVNEYVVQGDGKSKRQSVFSTEGKKLKLQMTAGLQISSSEIVLPSDYRNHLRLVRFKY